MLSTSSRSATILGRSVITRAAAASAVSGARRESTAAAAWKLSSANKHGLSKQLDSTMHDGSHDMKAFGLGFLRSLATRHEQQRMKVFLWHTYSTLEESLDRCRGPCATVWSAYEKELRRKDALEEDLEMLQVPAGERGPSLATKAYTDRMKHVTASDPDLLIGHLYTRYFADLFGGSMQGYPTKLALALPRDLEFYRFPESVERDRRAYIERLYTSINEVAEGMRREQRAAIVNEARLAFKHNANAYTERPNLYGGAGVGAVRTGAGMLYGGLVNRGEMTDWLAKLGVIKQKA